jgi:hypothetical protein
MAGAFNGLFAAGQALSNAAKGYTDYQDQQQDRSIALQNNALGQTYTQAQIDALNLANQQKQSEIANDEQLKADTIAAQRSQQSATDASQNQSQSLHPGAVLAAAAAPANAIAAGAGTLATMREQQMQQQNSQQANSARQTQNANLPAPLRNNNPGALMGKDGKLQQFPTLQAGQQALDSNLASYGAKGVNTIADVVNKWAPASAGNDSQSYIKDVSQRLGIPPDQQINLQDPKVRAALGNAIAIHENGRAAVESTAQDARAGQAQQQQQQGAQLAQNALQQPSPATQVQAHEAAGVEIPAPAYQQAATAQAKHVALLRDIAQRSLASGNTKAYDSLTAKADEEEGKALDLRKKALDVQKDASEQVSKLAGSVTDQASYDSMKGQLQQNPDLMQMTRGLNLTGNYDSDKQALGTLADRLLTKKDQTDLQIRQGKLEVDRAHEAREQRKDDSVKVDETLARQQAADADSQRAEVARKQGVPFVPSIAATAPPGMSQATIAKTQDRINAVNNKFDEGQRTAATGVVAVRDNADKMYTTVAQHPELVGGALIGAINKFQTTGVWPAGVPAETQILYKEGNQMVLDFQKSAPPGAQRSAATAAMANIISTAKPNIFQSPEAFKTVAHQIYIANASQANMNKFLDDFRAANPDAPIQSGYLAYRKYERDLGPTMIWNSKTGKYDPSTATVPQLEGGRPNPDYVSPNAYFAHGGKK